MDLLAKIKSILSPEEINRARIQLALMLIGMFLEMLGVGLVIPLITLLTQERAGLGGSLLPFFGDNTRGFDQATLIGVVMAILVVVYLIKNLFLAFLLWSQSRFAYGVQASLSRRLFSVYLHQPYAFHLQQNSAQLIRNATTEANLFASHALMQGMQLVAESMVVAGLVLLLMLLEPLGMLGVVLALGTATTLFFRVTRARVLIWGGQRQTHEGLRLQHLQQGLGGIKDVILTGRMDAFLERYDLHNVAAAVAARQQEFLKQVPRLSLEWLSIFGLAVLVASMVIRGEELADVAPVVAAFGAAAFRLMPSLNRILNAIQTLRYMSPVIDALQRQVLLPVSRSDAEGAPLPFEREIEVANVRFSYQPDRPPALQNVTLTIRKGETVGFVGTSGSGKSTLIDVILGLLAPDDGSVKVDGRNINSNLREWQAMVGYVPQSIYLTDDTLRRNVAFGVPDGQIDEVAIGAAISAAQLDDFVAGLPDGLSTIVGERGVRLSGGQRQRIGIARALYHNPAVLVLDEATSALDNNTERGFMDAVEALHGRKTILIVAHRLSTVEKCDQIVQLENGKLVNSHVE